VKSQITVVESNEEEYDRESAVATFDMDEDGNVIVGADLKKFIGSMKIDEILAQPIVDNYNSMFGKLIVSDSTFSIYEQAFFDLFIYSLALKIKYEGEI
jgi:hypothetical protein